MSVWEKAILRSVDSRGRSADKQSIYSTLESGAFIQLTEDNLRPTQWGGRPAYQHQVRSYLSNLVRSGDLHRIERGTYQLTDKGRRRIDLAPPNSFT